LAASVNLPPNIKAEAFIVTNEVILSKENDLLTTLAKCSKVNIVENETNVPSKGCGITNIGPNKIFLNFGAHINI
jgi:hypothetical protein